MTNSKPLRILHILDHSLPLHSGYVFRTMNILQEQRKLGWETFHLTTPRQNAADGGAETIDGYDFLRTPAPPKWTAKIPVLSEVAQMLATRRQLKRVVSQINPDIIHAHSPVLNALPALSLRKKIGIPVVYEIRAFWEDASVDHGTSKEGGLRYRLTRAIETHVMRQADAVTTICNGLFQDIVARGISANKVTIIPNAVDIDQFPADREYPEKLAKTLGLNGKTVIGFIGSFYAYEGLDLLLEAIPGIARRHAGIRLLLVGGGPEETKLKDRVEKLGIANMVLFTGRVPHADVKDYYRLIDILAFPRRSMRLTEIVTPLKPLEAMAQKKVLVASNVGGHKELIENGETGYLFQADNKSELISSICHALDDRTSRDRIGENGRRFVEDERNWRVSIARYREVYASIQTSGV